MKCGKVTMLPPTSFSSTIKKKSQQQEKIIKIHLSWNGSKEPPFPPTFIRKGRGLLSILRINEEIDSLSNSDYFLQQSKKINRIKKFKLHQTGVGSFFRSETKTKQLHLRGCMGNKHQEQNSAGSLNFIYIFFFMQSRFFS